MLKSEPIQMTNKVIYVNELMLPVVKGVLN